MRVALPGGTAGKHITGVRVFVPVMEIAADRADQRAAVFQAYRPAVGGGHFVITGDPRAQKLNAFLYGFMRVPQ
ncbi:hypothetical protein SDC9_184979 [bioreactor metagenome]|uniref:Uncharacterized protein n=1 Tax=bioreactor metagenome TaxID=1076179 RepID=A0A645HFE4_9ZZZZ